MRSAFIAFAVLLATLSFAGTKPENKTNVVDEGTFAIFLHGQRVATETFSIRQFPDSSITHSELHVDANAQSGGAQQQSSDLTLRSDASLVRYEWKELAPGHNSAIVEPVDNFLTMHINTDGKVTQQPFFLTPAVFVLDDYFFSTREVLIWRYMATSCKPHANGDGCDLTRARFPVLVPRRHTSSEVFIEFKGFDDTPLNGRPQHLRHFLLQTEGRDWHLWLDENQKLVRVSIPDAGTEVLRQ
jgi:hypothetical protein